MWDTLFPYSKSTPEVSKHDRRSSHRSLWLTAAVIYPATLHTEHRKFLAALQYTHSTSMDAVVYITTVVEHLLHRYLQFPVRKANAADTIRHNLLILPNYDEPDFPQHVAGAFLGRFSNWTTTLLWGSKAEMGAPLRGSAER